MYSKAIKVRDKHINIVFICCYIQWILFPTRLNLVSAGKCDVSLPLYKQEVTLIQAWISNYIHKKVWDEITILSQTSTVEVWE